VKCQCLFGSRLENFMAQVTPKLWARVQSFGSAFQQAFNRRSPVMVAELWRCEYLPGKNGELHGQAVIAFVLVYSCARLKPLEPGVGGFLDECPGHRR
jgi:hypothetical protein